MTTDARENNNKKGLERREFLKLGAAGVTATLAGCAIAEKGAQVPTATPGPAAVTPETSAQMTTKIPEIGDLIDPLTARAENWQEPWTWRPELWPGSNLDLNVVENQNPGDSQSPGNPVPSLFSYNGTNPGPTVRVRGDGVIRFKVRNTMGLNEQETQVGPAPDAFEFVPEVRQKICALAEAQVRGGDPENPRNCQPFRFPEQQLQVVRTQVRPGWDIGGHINGPHGAHTTNLHTHGLHVFPQRMAHTPTTSHCGLFPRPTSKQESQPGAMVQMYWPTMNTSVNSITRYSWLLNAMEKRCRIHRGHTGITRTRMVRPMTRWPVAWPVSWW